MDSEEDGEVEVNTISSDMKPMNMTETTSLCNVCCRKTTIMYCRMT